MSENLQKYAVSVEFDAAISKIRKLKTATKALNKTQTNALLYQIQLQKRLNALQGASTGGKIIGATEVLKLPPTTTTKPKKPQKQDQMLPNRKMYEKQINAEAKAAERMARAVKRAKDTILNSQYMLKVNVSSQQKVAQAAIREQLAHATTLSDVRKIVNHHKANTAQMKKQSFLMERMRASSKQFAGNMIGAFAVAAGVKSVVTVGQDFESVNNTMLAVSSSSEEAGKNFKFVQGEAYRLGLGLKESAKGFAKMAAARGDLSLEDTKKAFTGVAEMSTLLGLSTEESGRAINALQQMMSKGVVSAEELKLQMGEVLPNAIPLMAKAAQKAGLSVNGTVKEMMDLQQKGALISSKVLPFFAQELSKAAQANGGLENAMNSNRVAMGRLITSYQIAADEMFKSGFSDGLTEFFNSAAGFIKNNMDLWKSLGKIAGSVLSGVSKILSAVGSTLNLLGSALKFVTDLLGDFSGIAAVAFSPLLWVTGANTAIGGITGVSAALGILQKTALGIAAPFVMVLAVLEEVAEFFHPTGKKTAIGFSVDDISDGINKFKEEIKELGTLPAIMTHVGDKGLQSDAAKLGLTGAIMKQIYSGAETSVNKNKEAKINLKGDLILDGAAVGSFVATNSQVNELIQAGLSESNTNNY